MSAVKRLIWSVIFFGALIALGIAHADNKIGAWVQVHSDTWTVANSLATNVATLTNTSGIDLPPGGSVSVVVCGDVPGHNITAGTMRAYVQLPVAENNTDGGTIYGGAATVAFQWMAYSTLDFTPTTGAQCAASGDKQSLVGAGRIVWVPDTFTVSAGTTISTTLTRRRGLTVTPGN
jgi:hypothetical protein